MTSDYASQRYTVSVGRKGLEGFLAMPPEPRGLIIFAHGSGSSRHSPRNALVASALHKNGYATLLFDLLTPEESRDRRNVFDIPLLAQRVRDAVHWAHEISRTGRLPIGLFGASTGAAAALRAAADEAGIVRAIVSRGGRTDLTGDALDRVKAPTLLVVGEDDTQVLELNRATTARMTCKTKLEIIPGATHLFEEPGALEGVIAAANGWFDTHLGARRKSRMDGGSARGTHP